MSSFKGVLCLFDCSYVCWLVCWCVLSNSFIKVVVGRKTFPGLLLWVERRWYERKGAEMMWREVGWEKMRWEEMRLDEMRSIIWPYRYIYIYTHMIPIVWLLCPPPNLHTFPQQKNLAGEANDLSTQLLGSRQSPPTESLKQWIFMPKRCHELGWLTLHIQNPGNTWWVGVWNP